MGAGIAANNEERKPVERNLKARGRVSQWFSSSKPSLSNAGSVVNKEISSQIAACCPQKRVVATVVNFRGSNT